MISKRPIRLLAPVDDENHLFPRVDAGVVVATAQRSYSAGAGTALAHHSVVSP